MTKQTESTIKGQVLNLARDARKSMLTYRVALGRAVLSLYALDPVLNLNKPNTRPAKDTVLKWLRDANEDETSSQTLDACVYLAQRTTDADIKAFADAGMTFRQVHAMYLALSEDQKTLAAEVKAIKAGVVKSFSRYSKMLENGRDGERKPGANAGVPHDRSAPDGSRQYIVSITIRGGEDRETIINGLRSHFSGVKRVVSDWHNAILEALKSVEK